MIQPSGWGWTGGPTALTQGETGGRGRKTRRAVRTPPTPLRTRYLPNVLTKQQLRPTPSRGSSSPRSFGKSPFLTSTRNCFPHNVTQHHALTHRLLTPPPHPPPATADTNPPSFPPTPTPNKQSERSQPLPLSLDWSSASLRGGSGGLAPPAGGVVLRVLAFPDL